MRPPCTLVLCAALAASATIAMAPRHARAQGATTGSMRELARQVALDFTMRGTTAEREGQPVAAEDYFHRAFDADAGFLPPYLAYARLLAARGHGSEALHVLTVVPLRALETDRDLIDLARVRAQLGDVDGALELLEARTESAEAARGRAELAAAAARFPEALRAARHFADLVQGSDAARHAALLVRALVILVGNADAVTVPSQPARALRRALAQ